MSNLSDFIGGSGSGGGGIPLGGVIEIDSDESHLVLEDGSEYLRNGSVLSSAIGYSDDVVDYGYNGTSFELVDSLNINTEFSAYPNVVFSYSGNIFIQCSNGIIYVLGSDLNTLKILNTDRGNSAFITAVDCIVYGNYVQLSTGSTYNTYSIDIDNNSNIELTRQYLSITNSSDVNNSYLYNNIYIGENDTNINYYRYSNLSNTRAYLVTYGKDLNQSTSGSIADSVSNNTLTTGGTDRPPVIYHLGNIYAPDYSDGGLYLINRKDDFTEVLPTSTLPTGGTDNWTGGCVIGKHIYLLNKATYTIYKIEMKDKFVRFVDPKYSNTSYKRIK
jgi:hypothetical protein